MKKSIGKRIAIAAAGIAGMVGLGAASAAHASSVNTPTEVQAPAQKKERNRKYTKQQMADLLNTEFKPRYVDHGLSPKEYGIRFGTGASRRGRKNYQRMAHNAKVGRRMSA